MAKHNRKVLYGIYNDETELLSAVKTARSKSLEILDVYSPFPVHGLEIGRASCRERV